MGVLPRNKLKENPTYLKNELTINRKPLPEKYDILLKWSECVSVVTIRDQSNCGSCWVCILSYISIATIIIFRPTFFYF